MSAEPKNAPAPATAAELAAARSAREALAPIVAQLPAGPLRNSLHGALRAAERALGEPPAVATRRDRRRP